VLSKIYTIDDLFFCLSVHSRQRDVLSKNLFVWIRALAKNRILIFIYEYLICLFIIWKKGELLNVGSIT